MSKRPALITQSEVQRAIRAAKKEGALAIELKPDGSIYVHLSSQLTGAGNEMLESPREIVF